MAILIKPGVYVYEYDRTQYIGLGSPIVTGVVGESKKGPVNKIITVTNYSQFIKYFGQDNGYLDYTARFFFKHGGQFLKVVRVAHNSYRAGGLVLDNSGTSNWAVMDSTYEMYRMKDDEEELPTPTTNIIFNIYAKYPGSYINAGEDEEVKISIYNKAGWDSGAIWQNAIDLYPTKDDEILIVISTADRILLEYHLVSFNTDSVNIYEQNNYVVDYVNTYSKYIDININPLYINAPYIGTIKEEEVNLGGGTDGDTPLDIAYVLQGFDLYANKNQVYLDILSAGGYTDPRVSRKIIAIADERKDIFGILSIPYGLSVDEQVDFKKMNIPTTSYAAIYSNWFKYFDPYKNTYVWLPPAIQVTGIYAKNDLVAYPWFAPAGYNRGVLQEVVELEHNYTDAEVSTLYFNYINAINNFGKGPVVWGIKTLINSPTGLQYVNVRRTATKLEKDIAASLEQFIFELNTADLRDRVRMMIEDYLASVQSLGGLRDFVVICDESNNTEQDMLEGRLNVDVKILPMYATQYIILNFILEKRLDRTSI